MKNSTVGNEIKWQKRTIGASSIHFQIEKGAFGAAYIKGWLHTSGREQAFKDFGLLKRACDGLNCGGWVDDKGTDCPFEIRIEKPICMRHLSRTCETCDDANPFKIAARMVSQRNINKKSAIADTL